MTAGMVSVPTIIPLKEPGSILAGSRKWMIDSNTLIDIQTTTKNCLIFYTLDRTKPDPFKKYGEKTTYHFSTPFTLKPGKRTVKAIAVLKDGSKESSVNTKIFQVDEPRPISDDEEEKMNNTTWAKKSIIDDGADSVDGNGMLKNVLKDQDNDEEDEEDMIKRVLTDSPDFERKRPVHVDDAEKPFYCFHCHAERPRDPYARFCTGCGSGLPPAPGGIRNSYYFNSCASCEKCGSRISSESSFCSVCDSTHDVKPLKDRISCKNCSSLNPATTEDCLVCDEKLSNATITPKRAKGKVPKPADTYIQCPFCDRINCGDARFCDWCGKKPHTNSVHIACEKCSTSNDLYAEYCCSCGEKLLTRMRKSCGNKMMNGGYTVDEGDLTSPENLDSNLWRKMNLMTVSKRASKNVSTQAGENLCLNTSVTPKSNKLFNVSPGKGYWRQQIEYISHHLKVYAQNNLEFRESIANYVMSYMVSAVAEESSEDSELVLITRFALQTITKNKGRVKGTLTPRKLTSLAMIPSSSRPTSARSRPGSARSRPSSARSRTSSIGSRPGSAKKKKSIKTYEKIEKEKIVAKLSKLSPENLRILSMIKSSKIIDEEKAEELMKSEDFDPNTDDENGIPLLKLAVGYKHFNVIGLLVESGATVDKTSGIKESTALHEAVSLGITGRDAVDILLSQGASPELKDKRGQSPFDLALESGIDALIEKFTKVTSKQILDDVTL